MLSAIEADSSAEWTKHDYHGHEGIKCSPPYFDDFMGIPYNGIWQKV